MGYTRDVLEGVATVILAPGGVGVWRADGAYADGEQGIVVGTVPQSPDAVICLIPYPLTDDPTLSDSVLGLQVRVRGATTDPRPVLDTLDAVFDLLQGHRPVDLAGTARLLIAERQTGTPLGEDSHGRFEAADSYQLTLHRPSLHRS